MKIDRSLMQLKTLLLGTGACYVVWSMCRILFQGVLEKPSSEHLEAGAGSWGLVGQFLMAIATFLLAFTWLIVGSGKKESAIALVLAILAPVLFLLTARGLQRFAPGYSDKAFELLRAEFERRPLKEADVRAKLGEPLVRGAFREDHRYWVYSYMPSCGWGWDKKYVFFDQSGRVNQICTISEP